VVNSQRALLSTLSSLKAQFLGTVTGIFSILSHSIMKNEPNFSSQQQKDLLPQMVILTQTHYCSSVFPEAKRSGQFLINATLKLSPPLLLPYGYKLFPARIACKAVRLYD